MNFPKIFCGLLVFGSAIFHFGIVKWYANFKISLITHWLFWRSVERSRRFCFETYPTSNVFLTGVLRDNGGSYKSANSVETFSVKNPSTFQISRWSIKRSFARSYKYTYIFWIVWSVQMFSTKQMSVIVVLMYAWVPLE